MSPLLAEGLQKAGSMRYIFVIMGCSELKIKKFLTAVPQKTVSLSPLILISVFYWLSGEKVNPLSFYLVEARSVVLRNN